MNGVIFALDQIGQLAQQQAAVIAEQAEELQALRLKVELLETRAEAASPSTG